ncbi:MAG: hypothetical protein WCH31_04325 [Actinomycetes bacterium]
MSRRRRPSAERRSSERSGTVARGLAAALLLGAALFVAEAHGRSGTTERFHTVDTGLCPFSLDVRVVRAVETTRTGGTTVRHLGPTTVTLRNRSSGQVAVLNADGVSSLERVTGSLTFSGHVLWLADDSHVPFLSTSGAGSKLAPTFRLAGGSLHARVVDPCALVAPQAPSTETATTPAPWGLPAYRLSQIASAGLVPVVGTLIRHDHVHLDVIVNGRRITIPGGVGHAEPYDSGPGPCPPPPASRTIGDCGPAHFFGDRVALAPLHVHTSSGIIHIEADRPGTFTLGEFFQEWGVRLDATCIGGNCVGGGKELRVYIDGTRVAGDPRRVVLRNRQEIAVVFGSLRDFHSIPAAYAPKIPAGCGGVGEPACLS